MKWPVAVAFVSCACSFDHGATQTDSTTSDAQTGDVPNGPWLAGYMRRKPITITAPISSTLTDFPVAIIEAADTQLGQAARGDGHDLVFTAADGTTILDHELVRYGGASGAVEAWVRIPSLAPAPTTIYLYYAGPERAPAGAATWPSKFAGVWHLGAATTDSTSHDHPALGPTPGKTPSLVDGIAGSARDYDGNDDTLVIADPADGSLDFGTGSFSISLWAKVPQSQGMFDAPIAKGGSTSGDPGYCMLFGSGPWHIKIHDGSTYRDPVIGLETLGEWVHVAAVLDRSAQQFLAYRDGAFATVEPTIGVGSLSSAQPLILGVVDQAPFRGSLDEVRISTGTLSADWIKAEHANLATSTFVSIGDEQQR
ncbi:MAG: hypothetical protein HOV81_27175 [Kofleriaceae bacterium]|nr:hypothetical protein [Kofleriaceae bacterium]